MSAIESGESVVKQVVEDNQGRKRGMLKRKYRAMRKSPFAFFRATDPFFGRAWKELGPPDPGPSIVISGDLHVENFGAYRTLQGDFRFDINDCRMFIRIFHFYSNQRRRSWRDRFWLFP